MFKIGEFSQLAQVTIDTLRHYDALNLLTPAHVDASTGYRYYRATQLQRLNRIKALKALGFSLEEIGRILHENLTTEQLRGMLQMQQVVAERDLQAVQKRLDQITTHLNYLNMENKMPTYDVTIKSVEAVTIATIREVVPTAAAMPERCGAMFDSLACWMVANKLQFGVPMTTYFNEGYVQENIDTECAIVILNPEAIPPTPHEQIVVQQLSAVPTMATVVVTDDFYQKVAP